MALKDQVAALPLYKKVVGVGAGLFLLACLYVPVNQVRTYGSRGETVSFKGFYWIFDLPWQGQIAWSVLAVEMIAILVVTGLLAYVLKGSD